MIIRKDGEDLHNRDLISDDRGKDRKYSDTGRDGDYSTEAPSSVEEGDEDYDDETEESKNVSRPRIDNE